MKIVAIIQARMGSSRLPGKVLKDLAGETVLSRVLSRVGQSSLIDQILVATTDEAADDPIVEECGKHSAAVFRGDQHDVLDRYWRAAELARAEIIVRITSDCPLIDPEITDKTIAAFLETRPDYASNALIRTYPRGLDTEVMSCSALERAWRESKKQYEREHVTPYLYENPAKFRVLSITGDMDHSDCRWTLDTPEDLRFLRAVYERLHGRDIFSWRDVLAFLGDEPELIALNGSIQQKPLHEVG